MYPHPAYVDISHLRAPWKNANLSGHGAYGQDELAPPPETPQILHNDDGVYRWEGDYQKAALELLKNMRYIFIGGPTERVQVVAYTPEELAAMQADPAARETLMAYNARKWVDDRVAEGKAVFAPVWLVVPTVPTVELAAIPSGDTARVREAASTPLVGVLTEPGGFSIAGLRISWPMAAVGVVLVGGGLYWAYGRKRKGGGAAPLPSPFK